MTAIRVLAELHVATTRCGLNEVLDGARMRLCMLNYGPKSCANHSANDIAFSNNGSKWGAYSVVRKNENPTRCRFT